MNKTSTLLMVVIACLCFVLGATIQGKAQSNSFVGVLPFMTSSDRLGFFDQNNGKIFMYDNNFSQPTFIGQVKNLGEAIEVVYKGQ